MEKIDFGKLFGALYGMDQRESEKVAYEVLCHLAGKSDRHLQTNPNYADYCPHRREHHDLAEQLLHEATDFGD